MNKKINFIPIFVVSLLLASCGGTSSSSTSSSETSGSEATSISPSSIASSEVSSVTSMSSKTTQTSKTSLSTSEVIPTLPRDYKGVVEGDEVFNELFDFSSKVEIDVKMSEEVARAMSFYQSSINSIYNDIYFPADVTISINDVIYSYPETGVRVKGNTSRTAFYNYGYGFTNPVHLKFSFKQTFDSDDYDTLGLSEFKKTWEDDEARKERKDRNFAGMDKLDVKYIPRNYSLCYAQEVYIYDSFIKEGLLAPKANISHIRLNDDNNHSIDFDSEIVECVDKQFLKKRFSKSDAKGDLYKCGWGNSSDGANLARSGAVDKVYDEDGHSIGKRSYYGTIGVEDTINYYHPAYDLKTNDDDGNEGDFASMVNFINGLWNVSNINDGTNKETLETILDVDYFLAFSAMSQLFANPDDQRYNANNYYLYFTPSTGRAYYIAYDFDWSLGASWTNNLPNNVNTSFWDESHLNSYQSSIYQATFFKSGETFYSKEKYQNDYRAYGAKFLSDGILNYANYKAMNDKITYSDKKETAMVKNFMANKYNAILNTLYI